MPTDWEGEYVIGYTTDGKTAKVLAGKGAGDYGGYTTLTLTDGKIPQSEGDPYKVTFAKTSNGYSLKQGDKYLGLTTNGNKLFFSTSFTASSYEWTLKFEDPSAKIFNVNYSDREIQWNSNDPRFACYRSTLAAVSLYKLVEDEGGDDSGELPVSGNVYTKAATEVSKVSATLNATFSGLTTTNIQAGGFYYGTSSTALDKAAYAEGPFTATNGTFSVALTSLEEDVTYYYQAFMTVYDASQGKYVDLVGTVRSFVTADNLGTSVDGIGWISCYEMPTVDLKSTESVTASGNETYYTDQQTLWYKFATTDDDRVVITHTYYYNGKVCRNYSTLYDTDLRCPIWTAQVMHQAAYPDKDVGRVGSWTADPALSSSLQSTGVSSYSKGHLCASADRQTTDAANRQTFYYTNQAPQYQDYFNGGVWSNLEDNIRSNSPSGRDTLYVITGTLFEDNQTLSSNNGGTVGLPSHFYKCLMKCTFDTSGEITAAKGVAYIFTNEPHAGASYNDSAFRTTIDAIEQRSGFDFFPRVPASLQNAAEATSASLW